MDYIKGNFPNVAFFIQDGSNMSSRITFKCRILDEGGQAFQTNLSGLIDTGKTATIVTAKELTASKQSKVILNDILYSVSSIVPFIPDPNAGGFIKKKINAEYIVYLN